MTTRTTCPYCNTSFAPDAVLPRARLECPRCGETFAAVGSSASAPNPAPFAYREPRTTQRRIRVGLFALLIGTVAIGIAVGWLTRNRAEPKPHNPGESDVVAAAIPPTELAGLAYLPGDCNFVVAIQPGPLLAYAARMQRDPREMLERAGLPAGALAFLDKAGVSLAQIEQIVLGVPVSDTAVDLRLTFVLMLRRPLNDEEQFLNALDAKRDPRGQPRYAVTLQAGLKLPLLLVRVSPLVWVFGNADADLAPAERGGGGLAAHFRSAIAERIAPDAALWFAADAGKWAEKPMVKLAAEWAGGKAWLPRLARGQAAFASASFGDAPRARLFVRCIDDATGAQLRAYFQSKVQPGIASGGGGEWAMFEMPFATDTGLQTLKDMLNDAAK